MTLVVYVVAAFAFLSGVLAAGLAVSRDTELSLFDGLGVAGIVIGAILGSFTLAVEKWGTKSHGLLAAAGLALLSAAGAVGVTWIATRRRAAERRTKRDTPRGSADGWTRTDFRSRSKDEDA